MTGYIGVSAESDPDVLVDDALESLVENIPGFIAKEAHLEVQLLEIVSRIASETRYLFNLVPDNIFRYFGESLLDLPPVEGASAVAQTTWTMVDDAGYTIAKGTQVAYRVAGDSLVFFETVEDRVISPGNTSSTNVPIQAIDAGVAGNALGPSGLELIDSLSYVQSVVAASETSSGLDSESDDEYLSRLNAEMKLLSPRFVLAEDAAVLARRVNGVHRALALDNYDPVAETYGNEKMITLAVVAEDGTAVGEAVKTELKAYLESLRELNFVVHIIDPTFEGLTINFSITALDGFDSVDLVARANTAVEEYISPANWAGGDEDPPAWRTSTVVRYLEVAEVINRVEGVDYIQALTIEGASADFALTGVAPLTQVTSVAGAVVEA